MPRELMWVPKFRRAVPQLAGLVISEHGQIRARARFVVPAQRLESTAIVPSRRRR